MKWSFTIYYQTCKYTYTNVILENENNRIPQYIIKWSFTIYYQTCQYTYTNVILENENTITLYTI